MSMCRVFSCVVGRGCLLWPVHFLGKSLLVFALLHSAFQGQICLLLQVFLDFPHPGDSEGQRNLVCHSLWGRKELGTEKQQQHFPKLKKNIMRRERDHFIYSLLFCSVTKLCLTLCDPVDCSTPGSCVLYYLLEFAQTHVHRVSDAIQPFHPRLAFSPPALNLFQPRGLFQ